MVQHRRKLENSNKMKTKLKQDKGTAWPTLAAKAELGHPTWRHKQNN